MRHTPLACVDCLTFVEVMTGPVEGIMADRLFCWSHTKNLVGFTCCKKLGEDWLKAMLFLMLISNMAVIVGD